MYGLFQKESVRFERESANTCRWGEQAPMYEIGLTASCGVVTEPVGTGLLVRDRRTVPQKGKPRLLDRVSNTIRTRHLSPRTEKAYVGWAKRFVIYHGMRHPEQMGEREIKQFLSYLATKKTLAH